MENSTHRYLAFLKEVHQSLQNSPQLNISLVAKKHSINGTVSACLQEGGILNKYGDDKGRAVRWEWKSKIIPNVHMADELRKRCSAKSISYQKEVPVKAPQKKSPTEKKPVKPTVVLKEKQERKRVRTFSLLWGAIKFNY